MARIQISETQFAFAFFHKYLLLNKKEEIKFVFPTLREEGDQYSSVAGADLVVDGNLFFQFKMPDFLRTRSAIEIREGYLDHDFGPFYRFFIKNSPRSCQFNLLQKAAKGKGNVVKYILPMFHRDKNESDQDAFWNFFKLTPVKAMNYICSIDFEQFVNPDRVQPKDDSHKICYSQSSVIDDELCYIFSQPTPIKAIKGISEFNGDFLNFPDNTQNLVSIDDTVNYVNQLFDLSIDNVPTIRPVTV